MYLTNLGDIADDEEAFLNEMQLLAKCMLPEDADVDLAASLCWLLWSQRSIGGENQVTFRTLVNVLDNAYKINAHFPQCFEKKKWQHVLWTAFDMSKADPQASKSVLEHLKLKNPKLPPFLAVLEEDDAHILTPSRRRHAEAAVAAVLCAKPLLFEGPPSVGKTALVALLARRLKRDQHSRRLFRVNNTETTSIQDYFGTYIPRGANFEFQKGQLLEALERGDWFLADELNLADTSVLSALVPVLEGRSQVIVPGYKTIDVHPGFRFFATQNPASFANRNKLPLSFRNHFIDVLVEDFPEKELVDILSKRRDAIANNVFPNDEAVKQAKIYNELRKAGFEISLRDFVKWRRRHQLFFRNSAGNWGVVGLKFFGQSVPREEFRTLYKIFKKIYGTGLGTETEFLEQVPDVVQVDRHHVEFVDGMLRARVPGSLGEYQTSWSDQPATFKKALVNYAFAVLSNEPALLLGPSSCKSEVLGIFFCPLRIFHF